MSSATADAAMPARNSSESPGRKNPISSPVSANSTMPTPITPKVRSSDFGSITLTAVRACVVMISPIGSVRRTPGLTNQPAIGPAERINRSSGRRG